MTQKAHCSATVTVSKCAFIFADKILFIPSDLKESCGVDDTENHCADVCDNCRPHRRNTDNAENYNRNLDRNRKSNIRFQHGNGAFALINRIGKA